MEEALHYYLLSFLFLNLGLLRELYCKAEISNHKAALAVNKKVFGLHISVGDAVRVEIVQTLY